MATAISVAHLTVSYHDNTVLDNISFQIRQASGIVGILGPNGAGKSTMLKALLGLIPKDRGDIRFFGGGLREHRKNIAYVPQRSLIDWDFPITVIETVLLGTYPHLGLFRRPGKAERRRAQECLDEVGMSQFAKRQISELSGGQQQRVFIARALAQNAHMFFLDEPFVGIDTNSENTILAILQGLRDQGKTVLIVHHDLATVRDYFDEVLLLNKELVGYGTVEQVFDTELIATTFASQIPLLHGLGAS